MLQMQLEDLRVEFPVTVKENVSDYSILVQRRGETLVEQIGTGLKYLFVKDRGFHQERGAAAQ
jgi:hypothetical protein